MGTGDRKAGKSKKAEEKNWKKKPKQNGGGCGDTWLALVDGLAFLTRVQAFKHRSQKIIWVTVISSLSRMVLNQHQADASERVNPVPTVDALGL